MERIIVKPPVLGGAALAELKHWLGISRPNEDAALTALLEASIAICEAFTGQAPLLQTVEETVALEMGWQELTARPVRSVVGAVLVAADGTDTVLAISGDAIAVQITDRACVQLLRPLEGRGAAIRLLVGIADTWEQVPAALRHGIIRLAAHHYRDRDRDTRASIAPPASVTALWRPWRTMRLT